MKNLNRFEYLQLAASLMPESSKSSDYDVLAHELFELAKAIEREYKSRYAYEGPEAFELLNHVERANPL
ncbi:hypothetical protein [Haemophilus parahaemolyticus]|uniref:hypothetical protein n=1 Tax=Haemophilus parahaemolyticus TaxID=735 RepID=UPI0028E4BE44|nr:hypothetical protein [Haemophilus parahaemolyticus]